MVSRVGVRGRILLLVGMLFCVSAWATPRAEPGSEAVLPTVGAAERMQKRWLFVWQDMSDPKEVDRMIARFPRAQTDGYNGIVFSANVAPEKAPELKAAAKKYGLDIVAIVMGGSSDRNY